MNLSLVKARPKLPPFPAKPTPAKISDTAYQYTDLKDVELQSLDGRYIYDEDIRVSRPDTRTRIPFGRLTAAERMTLLKKLRREDRDKTVRLPGHGEFPNCNMSYIMERFTNYGDYKTVRTCTNIMFTRVPGSGSSLFMHLFAALPPLAKKSDKGQFYLMSEDPPGTEDNFLEDEALVSIRPHFSFTLKLVRFVDIGYALRKKCRKISAITRGSWWW